jgi:hypothetical protein
LPEKANPKAAGPNGAANGEGNANANGPSSNNGKALGRTKPPPTLPPAANGQVTPASGQSKAPAQSKPSEPAPPPPVPPEPAKAIGFGKDKPAKGTSS